MNKRIILTDPDKCLACNKCISVCPVAANTASMKDGRITVETHSDRCIQCGDCVRVCDHGARSFSDDTDAFFADIAAGVPVTCISAPAIRNNFPEYKRLFTYLRQLGVRMVYDVSFGADITTWGYLKAMREMSIDSMISQPCPVIVSYVQRYRPALISRLAPVQSPAMCTAIYLKKYAGCEERIAFLSPCIAKGIEFGDPNTHGMVSYNVTYAGLAEHLKKNHVSLTEYGESTFDNSPCSLGLAYSRPGGLRENVEFFTHGEAWVRQVEDIQNVCNYLDVYAKRLGGNKPVPALVDALNCKLGCNFGSATIEHGDVDDADARTNALMRRAMADNPDPDANKLFADFDAKLDLKDFLREYTDESGTVKLDDSERALEPIYAELGKNDEQERNINCHACGYGSCRKFAIAVANGHNVIESCANFARNRLKGSLVEFDELFDDLKQNMDKINANLKSFRDNAKGLEDIALNTKIISINANIEAAHAGKFGASFSIVASEIKKLADRSQQLIEHSRESETNIANELTRFDGELDRVRVEMDKILK